MANSILNSGVSGGAVVNSLPNGVPLFLANDYGFILPSNAAPTPGPDTQGTVVISPGLSGGYGAGGVVAFEKVMSFNDFSANNWTAIQGWIPIGGTVSATLPLGTNLYTLSANQTLNLTVPLVQGFYALRVRLVTVPASGIIVVSGTTFPAPGLFTAAEQAMLQQLNLSNTAQALAACDENNVDYFALAQNYVYP